MMKMDALELFLKYAKINTQSSETSGLHPSFAGEFDLAKVLAEDLRKAGAVNVRLTEQCYVYGELPATPGLEKLPVFGFIAHMDTSSSASGKDVRPRIVKYEGGTIELGNSGRKLDPVRFPALSRHIGETLVVTDGTTLLGADDKAGCAEIIATLARITEEKIPHGALRFAFTPDEEIGEGVKFFDVKGFGADYAFTMDGGEVRYFEYQTFNAAAAKVKIHGLSVHPGSAKDQMRNALTVAFEFQAMLPPHEVPEHTCGFEGFYYLHQLSGNVSEAELDYLLRDHHAESFRKRKEKMREIVSFLQKKYGKGNIELEIKDQYRNMEEVIEKHPFLRDLVWNAVREAGQEPDTVPVRGGTDGAMLSFMGLPCPNLGTGGGNYHGEYEFLSVEEMRLAVNVILNIVRGIVKNGSKG